MTKPTNINYKLAAIILTVSAPILYILIVGHERSISSYWRTDLQPLFIFTNAVTSYYMFPIKNWKIPSSLLLLLTAFSIEEYNMLHNIFALGFFISCLFAILADKRYNWFALPYLASILLLQNNYTVILYAEIWAAYVLCAYHLTVISHYMRLNKLRQNNDTLKNI